MMISKPPRISQQMKKITIIETIVSDFHAIKVKTNHKMIAL